MTTAKKIISIGAAVIIAGLLVSEPALADGGLLPQEVRESISATTGLGDQSPFGVAATLITAFTYIVQAVAVILIIYSGFTWMLAAGNQDKIDKAKSTIRATIIGALIVLAAWGITLYVFNVIEEATGQGEVGTGI